MNNPTRNGKIARLPKPIREAINQRLENGATAKSLVPWLNSLAEHLYERGEEMEAAQKNRRPMTEVFSLWMTARMAVSTREIEALKGEARWRQQRQFCADLMKMRRAEQEDEKLQIARDRTELQRQKLEFQREQAERKRDDAKKKTEEKIAETRWPGNLECISPLLTEEQKEARWREILHIPRPTRAAA